jgi:hypothetical protein
MFRLIGRPTLLAIFALALAIVASGCGGGY